MPPQSTTDDLTLLEKEEVIWSRVVELGADTIIVTLHVRTNVMEDAVVVVRVPVYRPSLLHAHALVRTH